MTIRHTGDSRRKVVVVKPTPAGTPLIIVIQNPLQTLDPAENNSSNLLGLIKADLKFFLNHHQHAASTKPYDQPCNTSSSKSPDSP